MTIAARLLLAAAQAMDAPLSDDAPAQVRTALAAGDDLGVAARAAGLLLGRIEADPLATAMLGAPTLLECSLGWVVVTGRKRRRLEMWLDDGAGVRRRTMPARRFAQIIGEITDGYRIEPVAPTAAIGKAVSGGSPWQRMRALMHIERRDIGVILVYSAAVGLTSLAIPVAVQNLVNTVAFGTVIQPLVIIGLALCAFLFLAALLRVLRFVATEYIQRRIFVRFAVDLADRLPQVKPGTERKKYLPEYVNRFFDVMTVQKSAATLLIDGTELMLQTLIGLILLAVYHPALAAFDLVLVAGLAVVFGLLGRGAERTTLAESDSKYAVAAWLEDLASRPDLFRHPVAARQAVAHADGLARTYLENRRVHFRVVLRQFIGGSILQVTANVALLLIGGWLVMTGELTLGQLVAAELVVTLAVAGLAKIGKLLESFYDLLAGVAKLGKLIDLPLGQQTGVTLNGEADFTLNGRPLGGLVQLTCGPTARQIVKAARGADNDAPLQVNALPLSAMRFSDRRAAVWVVDEPDLVHGTVRENAILANERAPAEVDAVLHAFGFEVDQLEVALLPHGGPLTDMQAMALTLARAVLAQPHLLILDNVMSHLETRESQALIDALQAARGDLPTVVITPRSDLDLPIWKTGVTP